MEPLNTTVQITSTSSLSFLINSNYTSLPVSEETNTNIFNPTSTTYFYPITSDDIGVSVAVVMN